MIKDWEILQEDAAPVQMLTIPGALEWEPARSDAVEIERLRDKIEQLTKAFSDAETDIETLKIERDSLLAKTEGLAKIGALISSQDNRGTTNPMFAVLEKRETITLDTHHHDRIVWVRKDDGSVEADERTHERLELLYEDGREPKEWDRYAMLETDVFVTAGFTEQGCKDYLTRNGHNLRQPFIYAFGSFRNAEYNLIRNALVGFAELKPAAEGESNDA